MEKAIFLKARNLEPGEPFHLPPPAQPQRSKVTLLLENAPAQPEIILRDRRRDFSWRVEMTFNDDKSYQAEILLPPEPTVIYYYFEFVDGSVLKEKRQFEGRNKAVYDEFEDRDFQIGVYDPEAMPAEWTRGMLIYQIFPDSFAKGRNAITRPLYGPYGNDLLIKKWGDAPEIPPLGRDFYGGDLRGVIEKLNYLKALGVDCIYFTPIFQSPTNHRYDTYDYLKIDPMLGTEQDLIELVEAAHARDIKIILDAVFNHCSCDSIYFDMPGKHNGAYQSKQSPYYRWFHFEEWPEKYQDWAGIRNMPEFVECPEVEDFFLGSEGVTAYWLKRGIDGWRTDVTNCNSDTFWRRFRERVNEEKPGAYLVSEEWEDATHYLVGDMYSATMNYRFAWAVEGFFGVDRLTASAFEDRLATLRRDTPAPALLTQMNLLGSHDTRRILTACQNEKKRLMQAVAFQLSYPGAPMIYYGDEAGLTGTTAEEGRKSFPWGLEDPEILTFYRRAARARQRLKPLCRGEYETIIVDDAHRVYAFTRRLDWESVYAVFNAGNSSAEITIPLLADESGTWADALEMNAPVTAADGKLTIHLLARSMAWYARS